MYLRVKAGLGSYSELLRCASPPPSQCSATPEGPGPCSSLPSSESPPARTHRRPASPWPTRRAKWSSPCDSFPWTTRSPPESRERPGSWWWHLAGRGRPGRGSPAWRSQRTVDGSPCGWGSLVSVVSCWLPSCKTSTWSSRWAWGGRPCAAGCRSRGRGWGWRRRSVSLAGQGSSPGWAPPGFCRAGSETPEPAGEESTQWRCFNGSEGSIDWDINYYNLKTLNWNIYNIYFWIWCQHCAKCTQFSHVQM